MKPGLFQHGGAMSLFSSADLPPFRFPLIFHPTAFHPSRFRIP
jgi:hypothetical protein